MIDALTQAQNDSVPIPSWWPYGKYVAIVAPTQWDVADCNAFKQLAGWDIPTFNAKDLPHNTHFPEGTYLMYCTDVLPKDGDLCIAAHQVDKKYRLAWERSVDMDLYAPFYTFSNTATLFSYFTTIYSTGTGLPEEWDILDAG